MSERNTEGRNERNSLLNSLKGMFGKDGHIFEQWKEESGKNENIHLDEDVELAEIEEFWSKNRLKNLQGGKSFKQFADSHVGGKKMNRSSSLDMD